MLKLMIAEDEALERKALCFLLDKYYSKSVQVIHEVSNGRDAVEKAILYKPDIVLMDIQMPILDGLEAISKIKSQCKNTEFIILTAFNYFDYAKRAIKIGVSDYLLKPFSNDEFCSAIDRVIEDISSNIYRNTKNKELEDNYKKVIPYIEKQMVASIAYGTTLAEEKIKEYKDIFNIETSKFSCIIFKLEDENIFDENSIYDIKNKLNMLFNKIVGGLCLNHAIIFVFDEEVESKVLSKGFENILKGIKEDYRVNRKANLYIGVGSVNNGLDKLYNSYKDAKLSLERDMNKVIEDKKELLTNTNISNNMNEMECVLCSKIINEDLKGAIIDLDNILEGLLNIEEHNKLTTIKELLLDIFYSIIENIKEFIGEDFKNFNKDKILEELINLREISELKNCTRVVLRNLIEYISNYKKSKNIDVVEKAKKYIKDNYMKDISLDELSQYVSMSSFYLSRIFTKVEKISFREYLIKIRMEKAKSMLLEGNKSVKQISIEVGYVDQNYFSKAFKKYTNVSPKEYSSL